MSTQTHTLDLSNVPARDVATSRDTSQADRGGARRVWVVRRRGDHAMVAGTRRLALHPRTVDPQAGLCRVVGRDRRSRLARKRLDESGQSAIEPLACASVAERDTLAAGVVHRADAVGSAHRSARMAAAAVLRASAGPDRASTPTICRDSPRASATLSCCSLMAMFAARVTGFVIGVSIGWSKAVGYWLHPDPASGRPAACHRMVAARVLLFPVELQRERVPDRTGDAFPVAVLTWSGVASVSSAYYDVARTLGARPSFLILRVAIPAALPSVFVGLFMGLGASFAVLIVAEMMGVKAGLGWYLQWAQGWAAYSEHVCRAARDGADVLRAHHVAVPRTRPSARLAKRIAQMVAAASLQPAFAIPLPPSHAGAHASTCVTSATASRCAAKRCRCSTISA